MQYTMPEVLLLVAAIGAVLVNVITAWGNRVKLDKVAETAEVIKGHVNSAATKAIMEQQSLITERAILKETIEDMKKTAALLAQSVATVNAASVNTAAKKPEG